MSFIYHRKPKTLSVFIVYTQLCIFPPYPRELFFLNLVSFNKFNLKFESIYISFNNNGSRILSRKGPNNNFSPYCRIKFKIQQNFTNSNIGNSKTSIIRIFIQVPSLFRNFVKFFRQKNFTVVLNYSKVYLSENPLCRSVFQIFGSKFYIFGF